MLPNSARLKSSFDFARTTKGRRFTSDALTGYLLTTNEDQPAKLGLIVGKSVGNSVTRHRIARQIRHAAKAKVLSMPAGSLLVVRATRKPVNAFHETESLMQKVTV